jgi:hypothetical protein
VTLRLLGLCTILCSGCTCGIALCEVDSDCGIGGTCDSNVGVCINEGGAGGGAGGGSDGGSDGGSTALAVRVPPLAARPADGGTVYEDFPLAWQRSDKLFIWLESTRPLTHPALKVAGIEAVLAPAAACSHACAGSCYCFEADLSRPPLPNLRGAFALEGSGLDPDGKTLTATESLNVTRLVWRRALGQPVRATPAIGADGTVYVGTSGGPARTGNLFAISSTGQERWSKALGRIDASVLVAAPGPAAQSLYVGSVAINGMVTALNATGAQLGQCMLSKDAELEASPALIPYGAAFYANKTKQLIAILPTVTSSCVIEGTSEDVSYPDSLVSSGPSVFFVDSKPNVFRYDLGFSGWQPYGQSQWPGSPSSSYRNRGLAAPSGGKLIGAGEVMGGGTVFQSVSTGAFRFDYGFAPPRVMTQPRGPVVASDGLVLVGISTGIAAVSSTTTNVGAGDRILNTPALGQGGRLYALAENGSISEWSYAGGMPVRTWTAPLETGPMSAFDASPTLDCARTPAGAIAPGRPGILYAASRGGTLHAITVDARGIDPSALWPKYQKDPRNSGSAETGLQEFACP